ncbi:recombinase family protein [Streptomyces virginiae]
MRGHDEPPNRIRVRSGDVERHPCPRCHAAPGSPAARAPARSLAPVTLGASPRCPGSRNSCAYRHTPTVAPASPGGLAPRHRRPPTRAPRARTSASGTRGVPASPRNSSRSSTRSPGAASHGTRTLPRSTRVRVRPQVETALAGAREIKAHAPHCRVIFTVNEMKRLGRDAAELTALTDHLTAHGLVLEILAGPLQRMFGPSGPGRLLFGFFAAMAETEREHIRESTLEGLDAAARKGNHSGRPPQGTQPQPLQYRSRARRTREDPVVPEAGETAHAEFAALQQRDRSPPIVAQRCMTGVGSYTRTRPARRGAGRPHQAGLNSGRSDQQLPPATARSSPRPAARDPVAAIDRLVCEACLPSDRLVPPDAVADAVHTSTEDAETIVSRCSAVLGPVPATAVSSAAIESTPSAPAHM